MAERETQEDAPSAVMRSRQELYTARCALDAVYELHTDGLAPEEQDLALKMLEHSYDGLRQAVRYTEDEPGYQVVPTLAAAEFAQADEELGELQAELEEQHRELQQLNSAVASQGKELEQNLQVVCAMEVQPVNLDDEKQQAETAADVLKAQQLMAGVPAMLDRLGADVKMFQTWCQDTEERTTVPRRHSLVPDLSPTAA